MAATPVAYTLTCPRELIARQFVNVDGSAATYRCSGCEWAYSLTTPAIATPAVPATTVDATNNSGTFVAVTVSAGTLTSVKVNGSQVGTADGTYIVPPAGTINITYTVAPTWTWALPAISGAVSAGGAALPVASGGTYFTAGTLLLIDSGSSAEVLTVGAGATGTSIPVTLLKAHGNGTHFGSLLVTPAQAAVDLIPAASPWPAAQPGTF